MQPSREGETEAILIIKNMTNGSNDDNCFGSRPQAKVTSSSNCFYKVIIN